MADFVSTVVCDDEWVIVLSVLCHRRIRGSDLNKFHMLEGSDCRKAGKDEYDNSSRGVGYTVRAIRTMLG